MANFDEDIKRITDEILSDGTVDQIIREKVTDGIEKAIASSFNYGKLEKTVKERVEQVLVPFIESYDMSGYIVKLDTLLTEMVNKSVLTDNKNLLENFKFMMEEPQETVSEEVEDESTTGKKKYDVGKIMALKKAGWKVKDIADEMKMTPQQVSNQIYLYNKKMQENGAETEVHMSRIEPTKRPKL